MPVDQYTSAVNFLKIIHYLQQIIKTYLGNFLNILRYSSNCNFSYQYIQLFAIFAVLLKLFLKHGQYHFIWPSR